VTVLIYRAIIVFLSLLLFGLLAATGILLFLFSSKGDAFTKPYLKSLIEQKSGLPVQIRTYQLRSGELKLDLVLDKKLEVKTVAYYDLLARRFKGVYAVKANDFAYKNMHLSQMDVKGSYKGVAEDIFIRGKGSLLHAPVAYKLRLKENEPQQIEAVAKGVALQELLTLASQPRLAKGKVDVTIDMPHIGQEGAKGSANLVLRDAFFERALIKKQYGVELPTTSSLFVKAQASLDGAHIVFDAKGNSKLLSFVLEEGSYHMKRKAIKSRYMVDVKEMRLFSNNMLSGPLHVEGAVAQEKDGVLKVTGQSRSFGGVLQFEKGQKTTVRMQSLSLEKVLRFVRQPLYASGKVQGSFLFSDALMQEGSYEVVLEKGALNAKVIQKQLGYAIPSKNRLHLQAKGALKQKRVKGDLSLESTVGNIACKGLSYDMEQKALTTPYHLVLFDVEHLAKGKLPRKEKRVTVDGTLHYAPHALSMDGQAKGLGKKVAFSYDGKQATLDAAALYINKVFALAGLPSYLTGTIDTTVKITDIAQMNGTFLLEGRSLSTQPKAMQSLLGKPVKMPLAVWAKGRMKQHRAYADASVKMPLGELKLNKIVSDLKRATVDADYTLQMPDLTKLTQVSDIHLYGNLALEGTVHMAKALHVNGKTASLGGEISYRLAGNRFDSNIKAVPLPAILKLVGYPQSFLGTVSGKTDYDLKTRKGTAHLNIASFQIKPNELTRMLTPVLGKDPTRIIFNTTTFDAKMNRDIVTYALTAIGSHSRIEITEGWVDQKSKKQRAKLKFVYGKYTVYGKIKGTVEHPKVTLDTSKILKEKIESKLQKKVEEKWGKEAGALLKGLGF